MICTECGKEYTDSHILGFCSAACSNRNFWRETLSNNPIIVGKSVYTIGDENTKTERGHNGKLFKIKKKDGKIIYTTNLWYRGELPDEWLRPANAEFLDPYESTRKQAEPETKQEKYLKSCGELRPYYRNTGAVM